MEFVPAAMESFRLPIRLDGISGNIIKPSASGAIIQGDTTDVLKHIEDGSIDVVFADPPYFLQLKDELRRPDDSRVNAVDDKWDIFSSFDEYDSFTMGWLTECKRVLKRDGTIWVIGTYHNIFRIGKIMQDRGFWILNDIIWLKTNPMPNFRGRRFTNAHETLIWAKRSADSGKIVFNYWDMKMLNDGKQMRSDWLLPICGGNERLSSGGSKLHSTQKPLSLLYRVVLSSTRPGDIILDPFLGTGTTALVAEMLHRRWIGVEREKRYVRASASRIKTYLHKAGQSNSQDEFFKPFPTRRTEMRVSMGTLVENGIIPAGTELTGRPGTCRARVNADGSISMGTMRGSIHEVAGSASGKERANGWDFWTLSVDGKNMAIDECRRIFREGLDKNES
jgi:DNA modification methylase